MVFVVFNQNSLHYSLLSAFGVVFGLLGIHMWCFRNVPEFTSTKPIFRFLGKAELAVLIRIRVQLFIHTWSNKPGYYIPSTIHLLFVYQLYIWPIEHQLSLLAMCNGKDVHQCMSVVLPKKCELHLQLQLKLNIH